MIGGRSPNGLLYDPYAAWKSGPSLPLCIWTPILPHGCDWRVLGQCRACGRRQGVAECSQSSLLFFSAKACRGSLGVASQSKAKAGEQTKRRFGCIYQGLDVRATRCKPLPPAFVAPGGLPKGGLVLFYDPPPCSVRIIAVRARPTKSRRQPLQGVNAGPCREIKIS